jgi:hypothetical protein
VADPIARRVRLLVEERRVKRLFHRNVRQWWFEHPPGLRRRVAGLSQSQFDCQRPFHGGRRQPSETKAKCWPIKRSKS